MRHGLIIGKGDLFIKYVIVFTGQFVDAIDIHWSERVFLIDRQVVRLAVDLPGSGKDDLDLRLIVSTDFQDGELSSAVDL